MKWLKCILLFGTAVTAVGAVFADRDHVHFWLACCILLSSTTSIVLLRKRGWTSPFQTILAGGFGTAIVSGAVTFLSLVLFPYLGKWGSGIDAAFATGVLTGIFASFLGIQIGLFFVAMQWIWKEPSPERQ